MPKSVASHPAAHIGCKVQSSCACFDWTLTQNPKRLNTDTQATLIRKIQRGPKDHRYSDPQMLTI